MTNLSESKQTMAKPAETNEKYFQVMPLTEKGGFLSSFPLIGGLTPPALPGLVFRRPGSERALPFS